MVVVVGDATTKVRDGNGRAVKRDTCRWCNGTQIDHPWRMKNVADTLNLDDVIHNTSSIHIGSHRCRNGRIGRGIDRIITGTSEC